MQKRGFTLLELIFVIVIVGIISAVMVPRFTRPTLQEAAQQVVSHIQYTQHLAMMDNHFDPNDLDYYKMRWQIQFSRSAYSDDEWAYTIYSDTEGNHTGNPGKSEMAANPIKPGQLLSGGYSGELDWEEPEATKDMNLGKKYGIKGFKYSGCGAARIAFDYIGRPITGNNYNWTDPYMQSRILNTQCRFILCTVNDCIAAADDEQITIAIEPETGYAHIL